MLFIAGRKQKFVEVRLLLFDFQQSLKPSNEDKAFIMDERSGGNDTVQSNAAKQQSFAQAAKTGMTIGVVGRKPK